MFSLFRRLLISIFPSSPSQLSRPGSFTQEQIEQIERVHYTEMQKEAAPPATAAAEACSEQAAERKGEDVALPMQAVSEEAIGVVASVQVEEKRDASLQEDAGVLGEEIDEAEEAGPGALTPYKNPNLKFADARISLNLGVTARTSIHVELNIIKHADFIFSPPHAKDLHKPRAKTWIATLPDGRKLKSSIFEQPLAGGKRLTTTDFLIFLALQHLLECKGWDSQERVVFSYRELAEILGWKWEGKKTIKRLDESLKRLRGVLFDWQHSFVGEDGKVYTLLEHVNILDKLATLRREDRTKEELFEDVNVFRFEDKIRASLKINRTKPLYLLTTLNIEGEIEPLLYTRLDRFLADKDLYQVTSENLFRDLRLVGDDLAAEKKYRLPKGRKQKLTEMMKRLERKPLSKGGLLHLTIEKTKDGKDWKLMARRVHPKKQLPAAKPLPDYAHDTVSFVFQEAAKVAADVQTYANPNDAIPRYQDELESTLRTRPGWRLYYKYILIHYPYEGLVARALATWKQVDHSSQTDEERVKSFTGNLHRLVHRQGISWIQKDECSKDCQYLSQEVADN